MPAWITSLLREDVSVPIPSAASRMITSLPVRANARATARPTTPAPTTTQSTSSTADPSWCCSPHALTPAPRGTLCPPPAPTPHGTLRPPLAERYTRHSRDGTLAGRCVRYSPHGERVRLRADRSPDMRIAVIGAGGVGGGFGAA